MEIDVFEKKILDIKERIDKHDAERLEFDRKRENVQITPTQDAVYIWNKIESVLDAWEDTICTYLEIMGNTYWSTTQSCVKRLDREHARQEFYRSMSTSFAQAMSRPWTWYVEAPCPEYYNIGRVFPVFGIRMSMFVLPKEKTIDYYLIVEDRGGKSGKYDTVEELEERLIEAFERGPHIPGQKY